METALLSTNGRIRRKTYILRCFISTSILLIAMSLAIVLHSTLFIFFNMFLMLAYILFMGIQAAKRMHDMNKSGWYFLWPFHGGNLILTEGTKGRNNYGEDPKTIDVIK